MKNKTVIPESVGLKLGTKAQVVWELAATNSRVAIKQCEDELLIQRAVLRLAEQKIAVEKESFK